MSGVREQQQLLKYYISLGQSQNISLHYTTNATIFPDDIWWDLWQNFKEVEIQLSIDGIGVKNEYIRHPSIWQTVTDNVLTYIQRQENNIKLSVSHTLSAYNIFYLDEFVEWCKNQNLPFPWIGRVHQPECMRPTVWPMQVKEIIYKKLSTSSYSEVLNWARLIMLEDDSIMFEEFQKRVKWHDNYRKTDFAKTFPEIAKYI